MILNTAKDVGALIRDRRCRLGMTQESLAERVGVSRVWVVAIEKGKPSAQLGLVLRTLKELGMIFHSDVAIRHASSDAIDLDEIVDRSKGGCAG